MPTFRALTGSDIYDLTDMADVVQERVEAAYPEVFATKEDGSLANPAHPKRARAAQQIHIEGELIPAIILAWSGSNKPGPDDLLKLPYTTLLDHAREVRRANPFLTALPEPKEPEGNADAPVA